MINDYIERHGDKYDYSLVDFKLLKIEIICPVHGTFKQNKYSHKKYGCYKCGRIRSSKKQSHTGNIFIEKCIKIYGNKYDYSKVKYINNHTKVIIICSKHGEWKQAPSYHILGKGCPKCSFETSSKKRRNTIGNFIKESIQIHDHKYNYSNSIYVNTKTKIEIICPVHGSFKQFPKNHLRGQGCPKCKLKFATVNEFIKKCSEVHNNRYDYSKVKYKSPDDKIEIICPIHGEFKQRALNHLNKYGCPKCSGFNKSTSDFIKESNKIHFNRYDYSKTKYIKAKSKVSIICSKHGEFKQSPTHHLSGKGCPVCKFSRGENLIYGWLKNENIEFKYQYILPNKLEFDFFIENENIAIEFDGIQHFKSIDFFGGEEEYEKQIERDNRKNQYCKDNNIDLIRISYLDDVNDVLNNYFLDR